MSKAEFPPPVNSLGEEKQVKGDFTDDTHQWFKKSYFHRNILCSCENFKELSVLCSQIKALWVGVFQNVFISYSYTLYLQVKNYDI